MAKTKFEKYYSWIKNNASIERAKNMIFFTEDQYVITNSYSLLFLNERPSGKYNNFTTIAQFIDKVNADETENIDIENIKGEGKDKEIIYKNGYSFKYSFFNNMKSIIKPDKIEVGFWQSSEPRPVLFLENTKTKEKGFLLPMKTY
jgi:hypothetical protein